MDRKFGDSAQFPELGEHFTSSLPDTLAPQGHQLFQGFAPDELIANRYRVKSLLGRGGMGAVYEAWDEELSIPVALKTLRVDPSHQRDGLRKFKQEAMLARAVVHPNVCRVYDLGCHAREFGDVWFLTMEVLRGQTLANRLHRCNRLMPNEILPLVEQMAAGLEAAHKAGVVHLDFKSGNVMLVGETENEQAVVTDFGLAQTTRPASGDGSETWRATGIVGTASYMSPEQIRGEVAGPAADIYSLGVVLYEMVTGTLPFSGETPLEIANRRLTEEAPSAHSVVPDLDERWEKVIRRCLEREPRWRFERAEDVAAALSAHRQKRRWAVDESGDLSKPGSPAIHTLPVERDRFVGRDVEIEALQHKISSGVRLMTLLGAGGMGKTRLAVRYGWRYLDDWFGGVWFCDLTEARDVNGIASAVGKSLGVPLGKADAVEQLGHAIAGRGTCLVILDNSEQVVEAAAATVQQWLTRAQAATFIVTSRERLGLSEESILEVVPMGPQTGLQLFLERARRLRPGLDLSEEDLAAVREVVRLVDGIPLAIELAAARMRVMDAGQLVAGMEKRFSLLTGGRSERHETLAAAIDGSWELIQPWEKAGFAQCSVFEGGFTLEAAESVVDLSAYSGAPSTVDVMQSLLDKSLLRTWMPERATSTRLPEPRFGMYVSLQEYARRKLELQGSIPEGGSGAQAVRAAEERHGRWYGAWSEQAISGVDPRGWMERRRALANELENLTAASRRAAARGDGGTATAAYRAAWEVVSIRGPYRPMVELGSEVLAGTLSAPDRGLALITLGQVASDSGRLQEARAHLEAALAIYRGLNDRLHEGVALASLGTVDRVQGRVEEARRHYEAALAIHREVGDRRSESIVLGNLGGLDHEEGGRVEEARGYYEAALAIQREAGDRRWEGILLGNVGNLYQQQNRMEEARAHYEAALAIHREVGNRRYEGIVLGNLGLLHFVTARKEAEKARNSLSLASHATEARSHYEAALAIHREVGNRRDEGAALGNLGALHDLEGRTAEALIHYHAALAIHREMGDQRWEGFVLINLGNLHFQNDRTAEAQEAYARGETLLRAANSLIGLTKLLCIRCELEHKVGNVSLARTQFAEAEALATQLGSGPDSEIGRLLANLRARLT